MEITDSLNLAMPFGDGLYAYHTPISREVYVVNYAALNAARAALASKGMYYYLESGPLIAGMTLRDEGLAEARRRGNETDARTPVLLDEIKRLTTILVPGATGYDLLPVDVAISSGKVNPEDWQEVESALVFFTCLVPTAKRADRQARAEITSRLLGGSITSSTLTEYAASLKTSTKEEPGAKDAPKAKATSSIPL